MLATIENRVLVAAIDAATQSLSKACQEEYDRAHEYSDDKERWAMYMTRGQIFAGMANALRAAAKAIREG